MSRQPRIIVQIESSTEYGRALLLGIARYSQLHGPWEFHREFQVGRANRNIRGPWEHHKSTITSSGELHRLKTAGFNGIITRDSENLEELCKTGLPCVLVLDRFTVDQVPDFSAIISDDDGIGAKAADYFLEKGYRSFGYCGVDDLLWSKQRGEGYAKRLQNFGMSANIYSRPKSKSLRIWPRECECISAWLKALQKPVAVMACNDERGQQVVIACKAGGLSIPEQVSVLGVDNDLLTCMLSSPPLSSISLNATSAGYQAAELLNSMLSSDTTECKKLYVGPVGVLTRQSSDFLAVDDEIVSRAVLFIRTNAKRVIQVEDVVSHIGTSRRALERRFSDKLKHSIFQEIRRARVDHIARIISQTDLTISEIALRLGYSSAEHIARFFKKEMGMSLSDYRKNATAADPII